MTFTDPCQTEILVNKLLITFLLHWWVMSIDKEFWFSFSCFWRQWETLVQPVKRGVCSNDIWWCVHQVSFLNHYISEITACSTTQAACELDSNKVQWHVPLIVPSQRNKSALCRGYLFLSSNCSSVPHRHSADSCLSECNPSERVSRAGRPSMRCALAFCRIQCGLISMHPTFSPLTESKLGECEAYQVLIMLRMPC